MTLNAKKIETLKEDLPDDVDLRINRTPSFIHSVLIYPVETGVNLNFIDDTRYEVGDALQSDWLIKITPAASDKTKGIPNFIDNHNKITCTFNNGNDHKTFNKVSEIMEVIKQHDLND